MKDEIPAREKEDAFGAIAIAILLILTAWGNALALLIGSLVGLVVMLILFRGKLHHGAGLVVAASVLVAILIAVALFLGWKS